MAEMRPILKDVYHVGIAIGMVLLILGLATWSGIITCRDIPGWCDVYYTIKGPPKTLIVFGPEGLGDPDLLATALRDPNGAHASNISRQEVDYVSAGNLKQFDLVLSNDQAILDALPDNSRYMTLFGIRMPPEHYATVPEKSRNISLMGSTQKDLSGHVLRWRVHRELAGFDSFGFDGNGYWKSASLAPYRFQIAIENSRYRHWATEKIWDAFALGTVPIYWGGITDDKLQEWGFQPDGLIRWSGNLDELQRLVDAINASPEETYSNFAAAIAHNRRRVLEIPCGEVALRKVICEYFGF